MNNGKKFELLHDPRDDNLEASIEFTNEQLCIVIQQGDKDALSLLYIKNEGLLYSRAIKLSKKCNHKLDMDDLIQSAYLGLMKAAEKFDNSMGTKFTTYAVWWIDQFINRAIIDEGFTIRIPIHIFEIINKIQGISRMNSSLCPEELLNLLETILDTEKKEIERLITLSNNTFNPVYLYTPVEGYEDVYLIDILESGSDNEVENIVEENILIETINKTLETLTPRSRRLLEMRFGLNGYKPHTLKEVGLEFQVTTERVRQIESKAYKLLKFKSRLKPLRGFYFDE